MGTRSLCCIVLALALSACSSGGGDGDKQLSSAQARTTTSIETTTTSAVPTTTAAAPVTTAAAAPVTTRAPAAAPRAAAAPAPTQPPATQAPAPTAAAITIQNFAFSPAMLTVAAGTKVTATNKDMTTHTWTADDGSYDASLPPSGSFGHTFTTPGTFTYHCTIHSSMKGTIRVT